MGNMFSLLKVTKKHYGLLKESHASFFLLLFAEESSSV